MHCSGHLLAVAADLYHKGNVIAAQNALKLYSEDMRRIRAGDTLTFGRRRAVNRLTDPADGAPMLDIEWDVLEAQGSRLLLISRRVLCTSLFGNACAAWKDSYIRSMLNGVCTEEWFLPEEQALICTSSVATAWPGKPEESILTQDRLFLLSADEVARYYVRPGSAQACRMIRERDADEAGFFDSLTESHAEWWLRTPGCADEADACFVSMNGETDDAGRSCAEPDMGVRPALWLDLNRINGLLP